MTILIQRKSAEGKPGRKCDAACYNAKLPRCRCLCGGMNHGKGRNNAILEIALHRHLLEDAQEPGDFIINPTQYILFPGGKP